MQFDILEYKSICVFVVDNRKVAKPLPFNQRMKEFYIGIGKLLIQYDMGYVVVTRELTISGGILE